MILKISKGNKKLPKTTGIISLPAGLTCRGSNSCLAWAVMNEKTNKRELNRGNESLETFKKGYVYISFLVSIYFLLVFLFFIYLIVPFS